jgi:hypothetical protein
MANWFERKYKEKQLEQKWLFRVDAEVRVPFEENKEKERETAKEVLTTVLKTVDGDVSVHTAIDSNIVFNIW